MLNEILNRRLVVVQVGGSSAGVRNGAQGPPESDALVQIERPLAAQPPAQQDSLSGRRRIQGW